MEGRLLSTQPLAGSGLGGPGAPAKAGGKNQPEDPTRPHLTDRSPRLGQLRVLERREPRGGAAPHAYLTPPVVLWDGEGTAAHAAGCCQPVELRREVWEVAVQVKVLCVLPPTGPAIVASTLVAEASP